MPDLRTRSSEISWPPSRYYTAGGLVQVVRVAIVVQHLKQFEEANIFPDHAILAGL